MERIVAPSNVREAYRRVKRNGGCPGADGMSVEGLIEHLHIHWQQVRKDLLDGTYKPSPVKYASSHRYGDEKQEKSWFRQDEAVKVKVSGAG